MFPMNTSILSVHFSSLVTFQFFPFASPFNMPSTSWCEGNSLKSLSVDNVDVFTEHASIHLQCSSGQIVIASQLLRSYMFAQKWFSSYNNASMRMQLAFVLYPKDTPG